MRLDINLKPVHSNKFNTMDNAITKIETMTAIDLFEKDQLQSAIQHVRDEVAKFEPDLSTAKGRKEVASVAYKVARSKTLIDALGKDFVSGLKSKAKKIDEQRKIARDELDAIRDEVRAPLDEWEKVQEQREQTIKNINAFCTFSADDSLEEIKRRLSEVNAIFLTEDVMGDRYEDAEKAQSDAIRLLKQQIELLELKEAEAKRQREAEEAERKRKQEEEQAALKERLRKEAEEKAKADAQAQVEREKQRLAAEAKAKEEAAARKAAQEKADEERRQRDEKNRDRVVGEIRDSFMEIPGMSLEMAGLLSIALINGKIKNVKVQF